MSSNEPNSTVELDAARSGDRAAFDRVFGPQIPKLRGVVRKMVGHPDDVDDLTQQTLLRAFEKVGSFRGDAAAGTWLCAIGVRLALDHLRTKKRWRDKAQIIYAAAALSDASTGQAIGRELSAPDHQFAVDEHIAYCFTCVGRTLEPDAQAALMLRDVLDMGNDEGAAALGVSRSVFRHKVANVRQQMQSAFEGLCALVSKTGACWQCKGLRDATPEGQRGPDVPDTLAWRDRLRIVRDAPLDDGTSAGLHDLFFRHTEVQERDGTGDEHGATPCGQTGEGETT